MAPRTSDKSQLPSRRVTEGPSRAPHTSSAMPISKSYILAGIASLVALLVASAVPAIAQQSRKPVFKTPEAAYEQGMSQWRSGYVELAIPALRHAADHEVFLAQYYLARILADNGTPYTDHVAAYQLYRKLALEHANIDPEDDKRKVFVARSLTALAAYVRRGLPQADVRPDPARAVEYLRHAAQFFNDEEAQFDLARMYLQGDGVPQDTRAGLHWLSALTQRGHAGAQAFLADIYWRGRYNVMRDPTRAFALITVAVEHAPENERVWIEDIYQNIYCGAPAGTRTQAQGMVADWRQKYGRTTAGGTRSSLGALLPQAARSCSNGETVPPPRTNLEKSPPVGRTVPASGPSEVPNGMLGIGSTGNAFVAPR